VSDSQDRAWSALSGRLRELLGPQVVDRFIGGTHTQRFADNLLEEFPAWQLEILRAQLSGGAGNELTPTPSGKRRAHAPYLSAALAVNAFGRWLGSEAALKVCGIGGFDGPLSVEHKLKIAHHGGEANLDCVVHGPGVFVGIESKLTEPLCAHDPVPWRSPYRTREMAGLLAGGWSEVFQASLTKEWTPAYLGVEQLVKHALALATHAEGRDARLVYCYWEPLNGDTIEEVVKHRQELGRLQRLVGDAAPRFHVTTYHQLLQEWEQIETQSTWLTRHIAALRSRYEIEI
jgi:hypothetical protein